MYPIVRKEKLADNIILMDIKAPRVAKECLPGQFIIAKTDEVGERIPLTICDYDREKETVTIVVQTIGAGTERMMALNEGDSLEDFVGPLGCPSELCQEDNLEETKKKHIVFIAGGLGTAPVYPQVKWLKEHGVDADVIMGFRNKDILFFEDEMKAVAKNLYVCTDDGSYCFHGNGSQQLQALVDAGNTYDCCVAIGPMIMMKFTCMLTKKLEIPTIVSMNPIMVDGTGMCGACRLIVDGKVKFACVDGPEFDGHLVDFDQGVEVVLAAHHLAGVAPDEQAERNDARANLRRQLVVRLRTVPRQRRPQPPVPVDRVDPHREIRDRGLRRHDQRPRHLAKQPVLGVLRGLSPARRLLVSSKRHSPTSRLRIRSTSDTS